MVTEYFCLQTHPQSHGENVLVCSLGESVDAFVDRDIRLLKATPNTAVYVQLTGVRGAYAVGQLRPQITVLFLPITFHN